MVRIQKTPEDSVLQFLADFPVDNTKNYKSTDSPDKIDSPLIREIISISGVSEVSISAYCIKVTKENDKEWDFISKVIKETIERFFEYNIDIFDNNIDILDNDNDVSKDINIDAESATSFACTTKETSGSATKNQEEIINDIKGILENFVLPYAQSHGGHIKYNNFINGVLYLELQGACSGCPSAQVTLKQGIANIMQELVPEVQEIQEVEPS